LACFPPLLARMSPSIYIKISPIASTRTAAVVRTEKVEVKSASVSRRAFLLLTRAHRESVFLWVCCLWVSFEKGKEETLRRTGDAPSSVSFWVCRHLVPLPGRFTRCSSSPNPALATWCVSKHEISFIFIANVSHALKHPWLYKANTLNKPDYAINWREEFSGFHLGRHPFAERK
jgi:hypothetical protein